jgi:hypothetical protein
VNQLYHISNYNPAPGMGSGGFNILLFPAWRDALRDYPYPIGPKEINRVIEGLGRQWLDGHGYSQMTDYGDGPRRIWDARTSIRIGWGEWGPEHICVPGNACGLDIDRDSIWAPRGGTVLLPHNVDSVAQASLLLTIFLFFADTIVLDLRAKTAKLGGSE